ncbi:MAG: toxin-antitoxin system YwqK family antitoxin [Bacteroidales bacterium]|jgi:antitoxin component YwqK of YwqJK toxin-antitoxin module
MKKTFKYLNSLFIFTLIIVLSACKPKVEKYYDQFGNLSSEISTNKKGLPHGKAIFYFNDGRTVLQTSEYVNGKLEGKNTRWYFLGNKEFEEIYKDGLLNGTKKAWDEEGNLILEEEYNDGLLNGISKKWYSNGQIKIDAYFIDGLPHGKWIYYAPNGLQIGYAEYDHGNGKQVSLNLDGSVKDVINFIDGEKVEEFDTITTEH